MINANEFKITCSAIGQIMTNGKGKTKPEKIADLNAKIDAEKLKYEALKPGKAKDNKQAAIDKLKKELEQVEQLPDIPELSEGAKTYCKNWVKSRLYDKKREFTSKQTDKGNLTEQEGIELIESFLGLPLLMKNSERRENEYMQGECDVVLHDSIIDIKSAFDCFTFPLFEKEIPETDYHWQVLGYMELWGKKSASVCYCLLDMPMEMIERELRYKFRDGFTKEQYENAAKQYIYSHIAPKYRVKVFSFEYDANKIEQINSRVIQCRQYIQELLNNIK